MTEASKLKLLQSVLRHEAETLAHLASSVDGTFVLAVDCLLAVRGKILCTGVGKSGLVARKVAGTLSSTGSPAVFLHPADAQHGDLGLIQKNDLVLAFGKSGESEELLSLLPVFEDLMIDVVFVTAVKESSFARKAKIVLHVPISKEACPYDLAPTSSTTAFMALGDALALTLMKLKGFEPADFARNHPGGQLGRRLRLRVKDLMIPLKDCVVLDRKSSSMLDVVAGLGRWGVVFICGKQKKFEGILTDGDLRRLIQKHGKTFQAINPEDVMVKGPTVVDASALAFEALELMEKRARPLNLLPVMDGAKLVGLLRLHDLLRQL